MANRYELSGRLDDVMEKEAHKFVSTVPYARHLTDASDALAERYYIRHRVGTVKRVRMTSKTDALALAKMLDEDYDAARQWGQYAVQELNHDILYLQDLQEHGWSEAAVHAVKMFPSTQLMVQFLERGIVEHGSLPAIAYSLFVEWNSARYSRLTVAKAESHYSAKHVAGAKEHVLVDDDQDHYSMLVDIADRVLQARNSDVSRLTDLIESISRCFRDYFRELYQETIISAPLAL
jgi:hypothetical protein